MTWGCRFCWVAVAPYNPPVVAMVALVTGLPPFVLGCAADAGVAGVSNTTDVGRCWDGAEPFKVVDEAFH